MYKACALVQVYKALTFSFAAACLLCSKLHLTNAGTEMKTGLVYRVPIAILALLAVGQVSPQPPWRLGAVAASGSGGGSGGIIMIAVGTESFIFGL